MSRWHHAYSALTGERYPHLLAYGTLLAGDRESAERLLPQAVHHTLVRGRRLPGLDALEQEVREEMARAIVAESPRDELHIESVTDGEAADGKGLDALVVSLRAGSNDLVASPDVPEARPRRTGSYTSQKTAFLDDVHEYVPLSVALDDLDLRTRVAIVMYHLDGLSVRQVAAATAMQVTEVRARLRVGGTALAHHTGLPVSPPPVDDIADAELSVTTITVEAPRHV